MMLLLSVGVVFSDGVCFSARDRSWAWDGILVEARRPAPSSQTWLEVASTGDDTRPRALASMNRRSRRREEDREEDSDDGDNG